MTQEEFSGGQVYSPARNRLIYLLAQTPEGSSGVHACDSSGEIILISAADKSVLDVPLAPSFRKFLREGQGFALAERAGVHWRSAAVAQFTNGTAKLDSKKLCHQLAGVLHAFWDGPSDAHLIVLLFILSSYVYSIAETVAYLHLFGPPASGKTQLAKLLKRLCFGAWHAGRASVASIYRLLEFCRGVPILDESDYRRPEWVQILRAGYQRGAGVYLCEANQLPVEKPCFAPKVVITNLPIGDEALTSRMIPIRCEPTTRDVESFRSAAAELVFADLRDALHLFGMIYAEEICEAYQHLPKMDSVSPRDEELSALMAAVALVIDERLGEDLALHARLVEYMQRLSHRRREDRAAESEECVLARLVIEFTCEDKAAVDEYAAPKMYLAERFAAFLNQTGVLGSRLRPKDVGQKLNHCGLILGRKVVDVPVDQDEERMRGAIPLEELRIKRKQRQAYVFDMERAERLAKEGR